MNRRAVVVIWAASLAVAACGRLSITTSRAPRPNPAVEALFARGLANLDPSNPTASLDSATALLDAYLAFDENLQRRPEAEALLNLALTAQQLARVEAALVRERAEPDTVVRVEAGGGSRSRDGSAVREIERLKEELAKANAELERIRKRLAAPKPPGV